MMLSEKSASYLSSNIIPVASPKGRIEKVFSTGALFPEKVARKIGPKSGQKCAFSGDKKITKKKKSLHIFAQQGLHKNAICPFITGEAISDTL